MFSNPVLELIQYAPLTETVHARPQLIVPPQINKFYIFDLSQEKSVARFLVRNGIQTFVVSWRNPTKAQREWGLSTYIQALKEALVKDGIPFTAFKVDDVHAEYARLKALGVEFTMEPTNMGISIEAIFDDTCGNLIQIYQMTLE